MKEIAKTNTELSDFPPTLRKLARYMIENVEYGSIKDACENLNLSTDATYVAIHKCKKKGLDLMDYVSDDWKTGLKKAKLLVRNSLIKEAINGSGKHQELFWKLSGEMVEKHEHTHDLGLTFVFSGYQMPSDLVEDREKEGNMIDVTPEN